MSRSCTTACQPIGFTDCSSFFLCYFSHEYIFAGSFVALTQNSTMNYLQSQDYVGELVRNVNWPWWCVWVGRTPIQLGSEIDQLIARCCEAYAWSLMNLPFHDIYKERLIGWGGQTEPKVADNRRAYKPGGRFGKADHLSKAVTRQTY